MKFTKATAHFVAFMVLYVASVWESRLLYVLWAYWGGYVFWASWITAGNGSFRRIFYTIGGVVKITSLYCAIYWATRLLGLSPKQVPIGSDYLNSDALTALVFLITIIVQSFLTYRRTPLKSGFDALLLIKVVLSYVFLPFGVLYLHRLLIMIKES